MVARLISLGLVLGLSALASLGFSPLSSAQAAYPGWSAHAAAQKNPQFRPWSRTDPGPASAHRQSQPHVVRPRAAAPGSNRHFSAVPSGRLRQPQVFSDQRAGARKAVPITRGQELGLRFRPDDRESPYGQTVMPQDDRSSEGYADEIQSQFRPARPKHKPTYEELQAESASSQPLMAPAMPYPMLPPPLPPYPRTWPNW